MGITTGRSRSRIRRKPRAARKALSQFKKNRAGGLQGKDVDLDKIQKLVEQMGKDKPKMDVEQIKKLTEQMKKQAADKKK